MVFKLFIDELEVWINNLEEFIWGCESICGFMRYLCLWFYIIKFKNLVNICLFIVFFGLVFILCEKCYFMVDENNVYNVRWGLKMVK